MAQGIPAVGSLGPYPQTVQKAQRTAWYVWCSAIAVTATTGGLFWDTWEWPGTSSLSRRI